MLKFSAHTGAQVIAGRFTSGTFTNQQQVAFKEPRLIVIADPRTDHQAISEGAYSNIPVIAFANTDSPLAWVDISIPCNNKSHQSIGLLWWMLAREVLRIRGQISRESEWEVMADIYFYRTPRDLKKQEQALEKLAAPKPVEPEHEHMVTEAEPVVDTLKETPQETGDWADSQADTWAD